MTSTITIAPVRKSIRVSASQAHAFDVFTSGLGRWWPRNATIGSSPLKMSVMEPRLGGRWYELGEDGSQTEHRKFEQMGAEAGASMRKDVDGGWPRMLEHFKREAEA